ncbi:MULTISPECIES: hypothetical protein [Sphingobium]|uniref:hypothetical protein n=1 Tax=Sphingobium TaxID=165695 RepID=UPI00111494B6|nr:MULTISPECIES: hypothetical protein [Sphingobium]WQE05038.1 hypothetical protein U0025_11905 [Sphingobium yanoikuyae]
MMPHGCGQRGIRQSRKGRMVRIEDQPRPKHRIAIFFIAPERKHNRNHCRNYLGSNRLFRIAISIPLKHNKNFIFPEIQEDAHLV